MNVKPIVEEILTRYQVIDTSQNDSSLEQIILRHLAPVQKELDRQSVGQSPDSNVEAVRTALFERSKVGLAKYGTTTERKDLSLYDWLNHLQQELMDAAVYVEASKNQAATIAQMQTELDEAREIALHCSESRYCGCDVTYKCIKCKAQSWLARNPITKPQ